MGRTQNIVSNPALKTLKWKNEKTETEGKGANKVTTVVRETGWYYWDKSLNDGEGGEVKVGVDINFLWLESSTSFSGYNQDGGKSIYSNEVLNTKEQVLTVKMGEDEIAKGLYNDIKVKVKGYGGKFCAAVYAMADLGQGDGNEVVRILMTGSARDSWFDISKNRQKLQTNYVVCYDTEVMKMQTGATYEKPAFKLIPASSEDQKMADVLYTEQVEPYFEYILAPKQKAAEPKLPVATGEDEDEEYDDNE